MPRLWQKGLFTASRWAYKAAREGVTIPIPNRVIDRLTQGLADESVYNLRIRPQAESRLRISGRKKIGLWLDFTAVFRLEPPGPEDPPRSLILLPDEVKPAPARAPMIGAMGAMDGIDRDGERLRLNLDRFMENHEWGRRLPAAVRERVRITGVEADDNRIRLQLGFSRDASR